jgi:hypothetical protein
MTVKTIDRRRVLRGASALALGFSLGHGPAFAQELKTQASGTDDSRKESAAFARFRWSFFDDEDSPRNGLDTAALLQLDGEERNRAEDMLLRFLPDDRAIIGLGELRSQRAEPTLLRLFNAERLAQFGARLTFNRDWLPYRLVHLAKARWQIRPDPRWLAPVTGVLRSAELDLQRMDAAIALAVFRDPAAVRALVAALDDHAKLVRYHAARSLLTIHGLQDEAGIMKGGAEHMMVRVMAEDAARRAGAKRDILAAIMGRPISVQ